MNSVMYKPAHLKHPETLVLAPYTFAASPANTSTRLQATAERAGVAILGVQLAGTGKRSYLDLAARRVAARNFDKTCQHDAKQLEPYSQDYDQLIGWGDSARGSNVMRMQLISGLFSKLLLRDAINLSPTQRFQRLRRVQGYFAYNKHERPLTETTPHDVPPDSDNSKLVRVGIAIAGLGELANYNAFLASEETARDARQLATIGDLSMRCVFLSDSFSGTHDEAIAFSEELIAIRRGIISATHGIRPDVVSGSHNYLMRPQLAATHLEEAIAL